MKKIKDRTLITIVLLFIILGLSACGPAETPPPTPRPMDTPIPTATPTSTPIPTETATPTPTRTFTPTPLPVDLVVTVSDVDGNPIPWARVVFPESGNDQPLAADPLGQVTWRDLTAREGAVFASAAGFFPGEQALELDYGPNEWSLVLDRDPFGLTPVDACAPGESYIASDDLQVGSVRLFQQLLHTVPGWAIVEDPDQPGNRLLSLSMPENEEPAAIGTQQFNHADNVVRRLRFLAHNVPNLGIEIGATEVLGVYLHIERNFIMIPSSQGPLARSFFGARNDQWHYIEISLYSGVLEVWLNGNRAFTLKAPNVEPGQGGMLALLPVLNKPDGYVRYDNLTLCGLNAPFEPLPEAAQP